MAPTHVDSDGVDPLHYESSPHQPAPAPAPASPASPLPPSPVTGWRLRVCRQEGRGQDARPSRADALLAQHGGARSAALQPPLPSHSYQCTHLLCLSRGCPSQMSLSHFYQYTHPRPLPRTSLPGEPSLTSTSPLLISTFILAGARAAAGRVPRGGRSCHA